MRNPTTRSNPGPIIENITSPLFGFANHSVGTAGSGVSSVPTIVVPNYKSTSLFESTWPTDGTINGPASYNAVSGPRVAQVSIGDKPPKRETCPVPGPVVACSKSSKVQKASAARPSALFMINADKDQGFMQLAVDLSKRSRAEDDGRVHPMVGAVIAHPNGEIISTGFRGQYTPGNHAEQEALVGINEDVVAEAVVYSTLEPCTFRGTQTPCCLRLIDRSISEIVIGILDPNPEIRGRGWWKFEEHKIKVRNFAQQFVKEIREMNRDFIDYQLGPGLMVTAIQPEGANEIVVTEHHRARREPLEVRRGRISVKGTYRVRPSRGDSIHMFLRFSRTYYPQAPIDFAFDHENSLWRCPSVWLGWDGMEDSSDYEIIVARLSEDLNVATRHYSTVNRVMKYKHMLEGIWIGIEMDPEPPGFERLASLTLMVRK
jgi:pyrimidine deaminase RibD-like protein